MIKFDEIQYAPLRVYNRCVMLFNINDDQGVDASKKYLKEFTPLQRAEMLDMLETVKIYGAEVVKKDIMKNMPLQDDENEEV